MGLFDVLRGKRELKPANSDRLFAITTANVKFETELNLITTGTAAIVFQPLATADFEQILRDTVEIVEATGSETGTKVTSQSDSFDYRWVLLSDPDFDDLVVGLNAVSSELEVGGYGDRVLCAVFPFKDSSGKPVYWIYNFKRGSYYPFVPAGGEQQRDTERELRVKAQVGNELPVESDLQRWFPLWGIPI